MWRAASTRLKQLPMSTAGSIPTYLSVPQNNILSASIENAQGKFEFSNNANVWSMKNLPSGAQFNQQELITLLARLGSLNMQSPLGKEAKPEYGLDKPSATVTAVVSDTNSTKVTILKIGAKDSAGNYPVISSDSTWYVTVPAASVEPFVNAKTDTFLMQPTPAPHGTVAALCQVPVTATPVLEAAPTLTATESLTPTGHTEAVNHTYLSRRRRSHKRSRDRLTQPCRGFSSATLRKAYCRS